MQKMGLRPLVHPSPTEFSPKKSKDEGSGSDYYPEEEGEDELEVVPLLAYSSFV